MSYSNSFSRSFTLTNAKYLASKVATDLKRIQRFYGIPSDIRIRNYETELIQLLHHGYLQKVTYGFKRDSKWIVPTIQYTAEDLSELYATNDDPGYIDPSANIDGAYFASFLIQSKTWEDLSLEEKEKFEKTLPFQRSFGIFSLPEGNLQQDRTYSSGGKSLNRSSLKKY